VGQTQAFEEAQTGHGLALAEEVEQLHAHFPGEVGAQAVVVDLFVETAEEGVDGFVADLDLRVHEGEGDAFDEGGGFVHRLAFGLSGFEHAPPEAAEAGEFLHGVVFDAGVFQEADEEHLRRGERLGGQGLGGVHEVGGHVRGHGPVEFQSGDVAEVVHGVGQVQDARFQEGAEPFQVGGGAGCR